MTGLGLFSTFPAAPPGRTGWPWDLPASDSVPHCPHAISWPRISIVTPSFNQAQYIEETLRSVLVQGYPNLEYIVIDGGSADSSADIIRKYDKWLAYWVSEPDRGQAHALNKGFARATGEIFAYLNSDDLLTAGTLYHVASKFMATRRTNSIMSFKGVQFDATGWERMFIPGHSPRLSSWLSSEDSLFQQSTFWTSSLHRKVGGFAEDLHFCFDKDFFLQCIFRFGSYSADPSWTAAKFRIHDASKTTNLSDVCASENQAIFKKYLAKRHYRSCLRKEVRKASALAQIRVSLDAQPGVSALVPLLRALRADPSQLTSRFYLGACRKALFQNARDADASRR